IRMVCDFLQISPSPRSDGIYIRRARSPNAISYRAKERPSRLAANKAFQHGQRSRLILAPSWPSRGGLASIGNDVMAENFPNPNKEKRVCFVPFLLRGLGFPIHPFLRGLLEFYGIQLHNLTPGSILHISGFVALCEIFLSCEPHFDLWRKYFCLVHRLREGSIFEVGGAKVWRIAGTGYPVKTP